MEHLLSDAFFSLLHRLSEDEYNNDENKQIKNKEDNPGENTLDCSSKYNGSTYDRSYPYICLQKLTVGIPRKKITIK